MHHKKEKKEELLRHMAAEFFKKESGPNSLITVTKVDFDEKKNKASISVSVYPEEKQLEVFSFVLRQKKNFIDYLKINTRLRTIPFISFVAEISKIDG
jgi:ribosome-binding factor A